MNLPNAVSAEEWEAANKRILSKRMGWDVPWYSWSGGTYGVDLGLSPPEPKPGEYQDVGRQETWEDSPEGWPQTAPYKWWRRHDEYEKEAVLLPSELA
jgi:predicted dithiol-disulfide oxidoreductase (DUF899 family)